jgi:iron complex outermembrane receptor protein
MESKKVRLAAAASGALSLATAAWTPPAMAQSEPVARKVERIEVTGSSIKRIEGETSLPVTVITRAEIDRTGATNPMELLQYVTANTSAGNISLGNVIGTTTFSNQTASLRGLGGGRTLVLINGKRVNGFAGEVQGVQGVNLSVIPFSAIERVEVLKDGASAIYGSDAIAGVINFIIRTDYRGAEASAYYGVPTRGGGGEQERYSASLGFGDLGRERYNVVLSASYDRQKNLEQRDRDFSNTAYRGSIGLNSLSSNTFPAFITTGGIGIPGAPNQCAPSSYIPDFDTCLYDPSAQKGVEMIPDDKKANFFGSAKFQLTPGVQAYVTALAARDETRYRIQPVPISSLFKYGPNGDIPATITILPSSAYYPHAAAAAAGVDGRPLDVRYRAVVNGLRDTTDTNEGYQLVGGLTGTWRNWDWDADYFYNEGNIKQKLNGGWPLYSQILPLLNSGRVNLFGGNTPGVDAELRAANFNGQTLDGTSKSYGGQGKISGEVLRIPPGPVNLALGLESRRETLGENFNPVLATGDIVGYGGSLPSVAASRSVGAAFLELEVPLWRNLDLNAAVRTDHYSDFGTTNNPKVSLRWQPNSTVLLRASYGTGFLAPSLYQLFIPNSPGVTAAGTDDPVRCPVTHLIGIDCTAQFGVLFGGNAALKPEKSEQATLGIVLEPWSGWSLALDYFKIRLNNVITNGVPYTTILDDQAQFASLITRNPVDPAFPALPGSVLSIDQRYLNLGAAHVEGVDVNLRWRAPSASWGRVVFELNGTYYIRNDAQNLDGSYSGFVSNQLGALTSGVVPRYKQYAAVTWERGPWSATVGNTYQASYVDVNTDPDGNPRRVGSMSLWDVQGSYRGWKNLTLTLGAKNVLDTNPPLTNQTTTFQVGFDPSYYDARARFVYGMATYAFR